MDKFVVNCDKRLQDLLNSNTQLTGRKELIDYLDSLAVISCMISKNSSSYAIYAPTAKKWITSFKTIFGSITFNLDCSSITALCLTLLKIFHKFEPGHLQKFYADWKEIITSFASSERAKILVSEIRKFEIVVQHLLTAETRWHQLTILKLLRLYSKVVTYDNIEKLNEEECDDFLIIMKKVIHLSLQHPKPSVRADNVLVNDIFSKDDRILSFQPYKILCDKKAYIVTDYDLWMDVCIKTKNVTFVALSLINKEKQLYGVALKSELKRTSNQDHTIAVMANWHPKRETRFVCPVTPVETVFYFSPRLHSTILEKLENVFTIFESNERVAICGNNLKDGEGKIPSTDRQVVKKEFCKKRRLDMEGDGNSTDSDGNKRKKGESFLKMKRMRCTKDDKANEEDLFEKSMGKQGIGSVRVVLGKNTSTDYQVVKSKKFRKRRRHDKEVDGHSTESDGNNRKKSESFRKLKRKRRTKDGKANKNNLFKKSMEKQRIDSAKAIRHIPPATVMDNVPPIIEPVKRSTNDKKYIEVLSQQIIVPARSQTKNNQNEIVQNNHADVPQVNIKKDNTYDNEHNTTVENAQCQADNLEFNITFYQECWPIQKFLKSL